MNKEISVSNLKYKQPVKHLIIIKEGFIVKQGGSWKNWKKRWCILTKDGIRYFKDKNEQTVPQGEIEVSLIAKAEIANNEKKKNCFKIETSKRVFLISAPSSTDRDEWIKAINQVISDRDRGLSPEFMKEINSKSAPELEALLSNIDEKMKHEIFMLIDAMLLEKELIINELMLREIKEVTEKFEQSREEISAELSRRELKDSRK